MYNQIDYINIYIKLLLEYNNKKVYELPMDVLDDLLFSENNNGMRPFDYITEPKMFRYFIFYIYEKNRKMKEYKSNLIKLENEVYVSTRYTIVNLENDVNSLKKIIVFMFFLQLFFCFYIYHRELMNFI